MSTADEPNAQTTSSPPFATTIESLKYVLTHVFLPVKLPDKVDYTPENSLSLIRAVCIAAHAYVAHVRGSSEEAQWHRITNMLDNLEASVQSERLDDHQVISQLQGMQTGDILAFDIRRRNAAIILTKREACMLCEAFEVSPSNDAVEKTGGPLMRSYPGSSVEILNEAFNDQDFQSQFAMFLSYTNVIDSDSPPHLPAPLQDINTILDGMTACAASRITKCVRDEVGGRGWRRSSLWLLIRVAIQLSVDRALVRSSYKQFILFFVCIISSDKRNASLSSDLLRVLMSKILRRLGKLGSSIPLWLSEMAWRTCTRLREILDARWKEMNTRTSPFRNPTQDDLARDTELTLLNSREYIRNALENRGCQSARPTFSPNHRRRGTIEDFLSSDGAFFDAAYEADRDVTLYDVGQSVEQGIDCWLSHVTNVDDACEQLETLMDKFITNVYFAENAEVRSTRLLTAIELYVAIDKLAVKEIPMLVDYPPEVPIAGLERLLLCKRTSLHRLSCAYQYLAARHSQSRPGWSVLSDEFTEDSFPVRYYDQSTSLQQLNDHIEEDLLRRAAGHDGVEVDVIRNKDGNEECQQGLSGGQLAERAEVSSRLPLPSSPLHVKAVMFELQCPTCVRVWRSATARILGGFYFDIFGDRGELERKDKYDLLADVPALQDYFAERRGPIESQIHLAYFYPSGSRNHPLLHYVVQHPSLNKFSTWRQNAYHDPNEGNRSFDFSYHIIDDDAESGLPSRYVNSTSYTSNDVLSDQADCPTNLSLDEFITFAHLKSGSSLRWLNILHGLRSRTLNLRRRAVHYLLSHAVFQVGPLDLDTGTWIWHQELEDSSFCKSLLDELEGLFADVAAGPIDDVVMNSISLLLARVLASSPSEDTSKRAITLLRSVRRKMFYWVQELSYDLGKSPTNEVRRSLLLDMAATCRGTFDVDPAIYRKLFQSAEDTDALLSCMFFVHILSPERSFVGLSWPKSIKYSELLLDRDCSLSHATEEMSKDVILDDPSNYGIDLAVAKISFTYRPDASRWEPLQHPNARWLTCKSKVSANRPSQIVHVDLLCGELRVDGQPNRLPDKVRWSLDCKEITLGSFLFLPSSLPGMDLMTLSTTLSHKVHFSLRDDNVAIRAQSNQTNEILELIPSSKLGVDLPPALVDGHIHWLNLSRSIIEIRPVKQLWEESSENWKIDCTSGRYLMYKGREKLVDVRSPTWTMLAECFRCLNSAEKRAFQTNWEILPRNLLVTILPIDSCQSTLVSQLSITLPYYGLSFFVNEDEELESRDFRNMVYDENQSIGTLFGLENLLILRPRSCFANTRTPDELVHRHVLIPSGRLTIHDDHRVRIGHFRPDEKLLYHTYEVDTELGCLTGNGNLQSTGFLADLHAMTDCHLPDSLTGRTGVQAAICLLQSAGYWSIIKWEAFDRHSISNPLVEAVCVEMAHGHYWHTHLCGNQPVETFAQAKRVVGRAAYLFSSTSTRLTLLDDCDYGFPTLPCTVLSPRSISAAGPYTEITLGSLMYSQPAPAPHAPRSALCRESYRTLSGDIPTLDQLFSALPPAPKNSFYERYLSHLIVSVANTCGVPRTAYRVQEDRIEVLKRHYMRCRVNFLVYMDRIKSILGQATNSSGRYLPISADILFRCLASTSPIDVPPRWKESLTLLALLLLDLQRARRLLRFALDGSEEEFLKELENEVCDGWNAEEYPDWLLIQIQGNFLVRRSQVATAMEMISPQSGQNTVMQVNMGEGKSSVIIPIAAAILADGKRLVRVIVPKALTIQMFEILVTRLGWLANRPIYHLPFSRSGTDNPGIDDINKLVSQCMADRGILLVQPEHVVSLKLMAAEQQMHEGKQIINLSTGRHRSLIHRYTKRVISLCSPKGNNLVCNIFRSLNQLRGGPGSSQDPTRTDDDGGRSASGDAHGTSDSASKWTNLQQWLHSNARDILDESDEVLHARFQLVYTLGLQQHMDGYPDRWTIIQQVLDLVKRHVHSISKHAPESVEYDLGPPGSFPIVCILQPSNVCSRLISSIAEDVMGGKLTGFQFQHVSSAVHDAIRSFISRTDVLRVPETVKRVEEYAKALDKSHLWSGLLILRGLLTSNVLFFALADRRWRVDYGLASDLRPKDYRRRKIGPTTTMLAVPYRAKDMPAPNTHFGHPDLTIILTCLSYYYGGLREDQLRHSFEILVDEDDASTEYALWMEEYDHGTVPESLRTLSDINLRSSEQWDKVIFPLFSRNQTAVNFYLSRVVFPKEAKEFPWKLSGSSWDLADERKNLVTGFSGTNDGRWLLPMSIAQRDLEHQKGTNAMVLTYLLRPENDFYAVTHQSDELLSTPAFLRKVAEQMPEIRVLLDVGSQILDFSNIQVATTWLKITPDAIGAIYFNEDDEPMVLIPNGRSVPLLASPLSQQLDRCVVYLDHAHTRGTDLKLPIGSRAAVTLGPKVTKDTLVQGCMRMRKLGHGHSVMFFAPPGVDHTIRVVAGNQDPNKQVTTVDILCWTIHETWNDIQQRAPYWAQQGMRHKSRHDAWSRFVDGKITREKLADTWLERDSKSLAELYAPRDGGGSTSSDLSSLDPEIRQRCDDLGVLSLPSARMDEEQEREVHRDRERERELERPPWAKPAEHSLHPDVVSFVKTGVIPPLHSGSAFLPVFRTLEKSSAATRDADVWSPFILATADFCNTVKPGSTPGTIDQYLRPVQWILSRRNDRDHVLVLLSPFEADLLMPDIRASEFVHLHLYAPRTSERMKPSDDLRLYTIPPLPSDWTPPWHLIDQLNVFAGQLYIRDYESYLRLCRFLGVPTQKSPKDGAVRRNLFNIPGSFEEMEIAFSGSPLPSVMGLLAIRTRGRPFEHTHMGKILQGRVLTKKDIEGPASVVADRPKIYDKHLPPDSPILPSQSDMDCDPPDDAEGSVLDRPQKRGLEKAGTSEADLESPRKRLRMDTQ